MRRQGPKHCPTDLYIVSLCTIPDPQRAALDALRKTLADGQKALRGEYELKRSPSRMLRGRCRLVDTALAHLWSLCEMPTQACLVAVGGYGRGELYPYSDIDILILLAEEPSPADAERVEHFVCALWDLGLDIGHSVRTIEACVEEASRDITIQTNLLESRHLSGNAALYRVFSASSTRCLEPESFFLAKRAEQEQRYNRFNHTPYALEPNCKESPGGLRDLQGILWVALSAGLGTHWNDLAHQGLITPEEVRELRVAERFMQQVRIDLHYIAGRHEDRLIFDHQEDLARAFSIKPSKTRRASELMMQRYFRCARKITQLNTILQQNIAVRYQPLAAFHTRPLNEHFQVCGDLLDIADELLFERHPGTLLESFLLMEEHAELKGMTARTLRALWRGRKLINAAYRRNPANNACFMKLLMAPRGQTHEFRRLNQYSILGSYIPAFGRIVGQMQHDLFHVYTVDQHILQVLRNVRRFGMEEHAHEYPLLTRLMNGFEKPWLLFIAALFHDIAKGRGGDHSKLGMADTRRFCRQHRLSKEEVDLVTWLVEHHLTMSRVAQKQDLADPDVIRNFAGLVGDERHLAALYILTHADIRGTSPKVWNGWKAKLLEDLFLATRQLLRGDKPEQVFGIIERQEAVRERLRFHGLRPHTEDVFWRELDTLYFLRHNAEEITWHTRVLYYRPEVGAPVVKARLSKVDKGIQVMVYMHDERNLFARLCGSISRLGFSIVDAKIHTTAKGYALDSFVIMDPNAETSYRDVIALVEHTLSEKLTQPNQIDTPVNVRLSRQVKHFPITPSISLQPDERGQYFILSIVAADRPGLLFTIAQTLAEHDINLHTAKISTLGERAEDTLLVSGASLDNSAKTVQLEAALMERLML